MVELRSMHLKTNPAPSDRSLRQCGKPKGAGRPLAGDLNAGEADEWEGQRCVKGSTTGLGESTECIKCTRARRRGVTSTIAGEGGQPARFHHAGGR
jgi:hypothetical protein